MHHYVGIETSLLIGNDFIANPQLGGAARYF